MVEGSRVYGDLQQRIERARRELDGVSRELQGTATRIEQLAGAEAQSLARLAKVRLGELEARHVVEGLDAADRHAIALLDQRRQALEGVREALSASEREQQDLEAERSKRLAALDDARARHGAAVVEALAELEKDESYLFQSERVLALGSQAAHAAEKAAQRAAEREEKGRPYEESKLFTYLWRREYGTPAYEAGNLVRALDGWVARLCDYDRARLDYAMLLEIPDRLQAHADRLADDAERGLEALGSIQGDAFLDAGIPKMAAEVETLERTLADAETELEAEERRQQELLAERAALDAGEDRFTREALEVLRSHLEREPVQALHADALRTPTASDDTIVAEIADQRDSARRLREEARQLGDRQRASMKALSDLEEVRRHYRQRSYDSRDSTFRDGFDLGGLLELLVRGGILVGDVMQEMKRNHRFRIPRSPTTPRGPTFPGGGISFPDFGSRGRSGGRSGGGFRFPRPAPSRSPSRPSGGGGFRTGGGF